MDSKLQVVESLPDKKGISPIQQVRDIQEFSRVCGSWAYVNQFETLQDLALAAYMYIHEGKVWNGHDWIEERRDAKR